MLDHVKITVRDLAGAKEYYSKALEPLGYRVVFDAEGVTYYADARGLDFGLGHGETGTGTHVGFAADDQAIVHAYYEAALAAGGTDNGAPGLRPEYATDYYAAYVRDPDGNNVEVFCHTEAA
jgi:catechol 2,3-dioxygenase-like lactoylglutathione lyase family enzyme